MAAISLDPGDLVRARQVAQEIATSSSPFKVDPRSLGTAILSCYTINPFAGPVAQW